MKNYIVVDKDHAKEALEWAKKNCPNYITNDYHMVGYNDYDGSKIEFFFHPDAKEEMMLFALMWSEHLNTC
jgi:hypothetical protein